MPYQKCVCILFFLLLVGICTTAFAQNYRNARTIPPKVYIGDRASLVLSLPGSTDNDVEIPFAMIPVSQDIDIYRVALERRPSGSRLVIEFSAYIPGHLELPTFEIDSEIFNELGIEISSILDSGISGTVLSGPALPLAVPGTSLLVYGTISLVLLSGLLCLWVLFWGRRRMNEWITTWKRRRLLVSMLRIEKRLRKALTRGNPGREILDSLSVEFRSFLAWYTGDNCRAMTAVEFGKPGSLEQSYGLPVGEFVGEFFKRCDSLRFSGSEIIDEDALAIFDDLKRYLAEVSA
jgi:hypothetical protein